MNCDDLDSLEFEMDSQSPLKCAAVMNRPHCDLYEGVKLEVSLQAHNMRQVAHLIIAMQRMKNTQRLQGTEFSDQELLNIMMENVIEGRPRLELSGPQASLESFYRVSQRSRPGNCSCSHGSFPPPAESVVMTVQDQVDSGAVVYTSTSQEVKCNVADQYQKSLVLNEEALELQAMTLQGGSFQRRVQLNLSMYVTPSYSSGKGQPVTLGIVDTNLYLSCSSENGMPILQLEEVGDKLRLKHISAEDDLSRFLFLKRGTGLSMTTFESARYQGWFISTALQEREPVEMCTKQEANRITSFRVK
ncbi:interleukin-1 beta-like [Scleropages formosus]|uniref:Interleukin-1 n=1 Tax=Scleropages formosus TaxID=113540 RepID=A0A0P7UDV8_SCLFO|nr:interleukin-1 beta-like [Scleropages formosus]